MSLVRGLIEPGLSAVKKTAPFYSAVDEALAAIKRPKGTGAEFFTELTKQAGVKKAELADRKLEQAFKAKGKMTKEEAQQVLKNNPPPKLKEKVYDESTAIDEDDLREMVSQEMFGKPYSQIRFGSPQHRQISDEVYTRMDMDNGTTYGKYKTPNGENYREILLKLPSERPYAGNYSDPAKYDADLRAYNASGKSDYQSSHFKDDANVLAHMRVQDRKGPNGEKILHVEEIQSDWHQEGRKKGYRPQGQPQRLKGEPYKMDDGSYGVKWEDGSVNDLGWGRDHAERLAAEGKLTDLVPDAPFKKNWHELAMKRLLNYAADNGYDSIAITPGAEQAKRYDLSKQVDELLYKQNPDGTYQLSAQAQGRGNMMGEAIPADKLENYVGKEVAQKIIGGEGKTTEVAGKYNPQSMTSSKDYMQSLSGIDLQVGGEGMKGFYDKILPDYLNAFGKPYGAQVGQIQAPIKHELEGLRRMAGMAEDPPLTLHNFPITPEMRESIKQKGLPLYQQIGIPTAGAGAASQMPEQEEPQYGPGGAITKMALKAAPAPKAPMIIKPSALTELQKIVQQEKGGYGARRLERAADEVPNLEKLYKEQALKEAFLGDNAKALMTMNPADFEKYAAKLLPRNVSVPGVMGDKMRQSTEDYVKYLRELPEGFNEAPYLLINKEEFGLPLIPYVTGHEGRHRNRALTTQGEKSNLVRFVPSFELREPLPRRSQEEYIEGLKQELQMTGNQVMPEKYWDDSLPKNLLIQRPPIQLPDVYAKGGAVKPKVKDSKSGKVRMTTNRDTMFMELSNKKLKRK